MYASRYGIRNLIIGAQPGGALATSHCVENYPGTLSESGGSIMKRFEEHAKVSGSEVSYDTVIKIAGREVQALDSTGAGDCFVGAVASSLAQEKNLKEFFITKLSCFCKSLRIISNVMETILS